MGILDDEVDWCKKCRWGTTITESGFSYVSCKKTSMISYGKYCRAGNPPSWWEMMDPDMVLLRRI